MRAGQSEFDQLIPWSVEMQHRWAYPVVMLNAEARRRAGMDVSADLRDRLERWLAKMLVDDTVVDYDPTSEEGFRYVPRVPGDKDLIRRPRQAKRSMT